MTKPSPSRLRPLLPQELPFGAPPGRYSIVPFPDGKAARFITLEVRDTPKEMTLFLADSLVPAKRPKVRGREMRTTRVLLDYGAEVAATRAYLSLDASIVFVFGRLASPLVLKPGILLPQEATLRTVYSTAKGEKILHEWHVRSEHPPADIAWALTRYKEFYAVDTNTLETPGVGRLSVTAVIRGQCSPVGDGQTAAGYELVHRQSAINVQGNPELHALHSIVQHLSSSGGPTERIGLITDTEYSLIKEINARRHPLFEDFYLPEKFELIYATSDAGVTEYLPNKMMRECDGVAKQSLAHALKSLASQRTGGAA